MEQQALHREIAKERFLELMAQSPDSDSKMAAVIAIEQANAFLSAYSAIGVQYSAPAKKEKGCKACFGSGGKVGQPCNVCHGNGKVPA
jgi:DnaJ-class molecular chaperone